MKLDRALWSSLKKINNSFTEKEIVFWSDNCVGQNKIKFMIAMYLCALRKFYNINMITRKFLIKGNKQNEDDCAHSLIEIQMKRLLKSGLIYVQDSFVTTIRIARPCSRNVFLWLLQYKNDRNNTTWNTWYKRSEAVRCEGYTSQKRTTKLCLC